MFLLKKTEITYLRNEVALQRSVSKSSVRYSETATHEQTYGFKHHCLQVRHAVTQF